MCCCKVSYVEGQFQFCSLYMCTDVSWIQLRIFKDMLCQRSKRIEFLSLPYFFQIFLQMLTAWSLFPLLPPLFRGRTLPRPLNWETLSRTIGGYQKINAQQTFSQLFELEIENLLQSLTLPNPFQSILILVCIEGNNNIFISGPSYQFLVALF